MRTAKTGQVSEFAVQHRSCIDKECLVPGPLSDGYNGAPWTSLRICHLLRVASEGLANPETFVQGLCGAMNTVENIDIGVKTYVMGIF
jgi:hypothetical protein